MKRIFTDADIYEDEWYQELPTEYKVFWDYICRRAEYGFWKPNWGLLAYQLKININPADALKALNGEEKNRVIVLNNGRWFIPSWVPFQYKNLSQDCKAHKPVFDYYKTYYPELFNSYLIAIGKEQYKEKDMEQEEVKEKEIKGIVKGKPTLEELKVIFSEKGFPAEAEKFFDYYESNGWRVGKNPMKKWQSAVANWLRHAKAYGSQNGVQKSVSRDYKRDNAEFEAKKKQWEQEQRA